MSLASPSLTFRLGCDWPPVGAESSPRSPWPGGKRAWLRPAARRQRHPSRAPGRGPHTLFLPFDLGYGWSLPLLKQVCRARVGWAAREKGAEGPRCRPPRVPSFPGAGPASARPAAGCVCSQSPRALPAASLMTSAFVFTLSSSSLHQTCRQACPFIGWRGSSPVFLVGREVSAAAG